VLRVSVLELPARWAAAEEAIDQVDRLLADAPPDLAIVPEASFTGYVSPEGDFDLTRFAEPIDGRTVERLAELCRRRRVALAAPLVLAERGNVYNALVLVGPDGNVLATYRKRHPWFPERWATPGTSAPPVIQLGPLAVTFAICFDGHFLGEDGADALRRADLLVFTSAWVEGFVDDDEDVEDSRLPLLTGLAREFRITIANANWGSGPANARLVGQGGSVIVDPAGRVVAAVPAGGCRADVTVAARPR
jgi:predicted amidohydrolase